MDSLVEQLKRHEGFRSKPYIDSVGKVTIGYGRNLDDVGLSRKEAVDLLYNDISLARNAVLTNISVARRLNSARLDALTNMAFNLGITRLLKFRKFLAALDLGDFVEAEVQMLDSLWAKQVGSRAIELGRQMRTGYYT